ncbi:hypothetical protein [Costertonia aggregata]|uniref:Uncharacterized protein n=1 Tax=Costertonia aggregata TaxID=343403 RepID=A0A7H9ARC2_9FLAO|nr:hypothetical protein [Costertonia aggregata]QLG46003.1 hypothetical protein HYG79_11820 [Costertonia aggregata]
MKKYLKYAFTIAAPLVFNSCNLGGSIADGISVKEEGVSVDKVYVSDGKDELKTRTFTYGQNIYTNFEGVEGFNFENNKYYPQMSVYIVSKEGDTVMKQDKLYNDNAGFGKEINVLEGRLILANPIHSGKEYTVHYTITDQKGDGRLYSEMDFNLIKDDNIQVEKNGLDFQEAYIMSQKTGEVITNAEIGFDQLLLMDFQGLNGYQLKNGMVSLGLYVKMTDSSGNVVVENKDAFSGRGTMDENTVKQGIASTMKLSRGKLDNPVKWEMRIWDKNSDAELKAVAELTVKN